MSTHFQNPPQKPNSSYDTKHPHTRKRPVPEIPIPAERRQLHGALMSYGAFDDLSADEAREFFLSFLESQRRAIERLAASTQAQDVSWTFDLDTLADTLRWLLKDVRVSHVPLQGEVPWWVAKAHPQGTAIFDESSETAILAAAYYLGETFARQPGMRWAIGDPEFMEKNMPVVAGFANDLELPPLVVASVMAQQLAEDPRKTSEIDSGIDTWRKFLPAAED